MLGSFVRKATKFLGKAHKKSLGAIKKIHGGIQKVKGFGTRVSQFLDSLGAGGTAFKTAVSRALEKEYDVRGMKLSPAKVFQRTEDAVTTAKDVLEMNPRGKSRAREMLTRHGGAHGATIAGMF
jgi:hypothetical protein